MAALGDERLFDAARARRRRRSRAATPRRSRRAPSPSSSSAAPGPRSRSCSPTSASRVPTAGASPSTSATRWATPSRRRPATRACSTARPSRTGCAAACRIGVAMGVTPAERAARIERAARRARAGDAGRCPTRSSRARRTRRPTRSTRPAGCAGSCRRRTAWSVRADVPDERRGRGRRRRRRSLAIARPKRRSRRPMTRVLVLQGPNLNLLGTREPEIYGHETLDEIHAGIARERRASSGSSVDFFQSNHEGALIDRLHERDFDVAIVNAGGLTHTSVALRDALLAIQRPFIEVHLSDPSKREPFRHVNFLARHRARVDRRARARAAITSRSSRSPGRFGRRRWLTATSRAGETRRAAPAAQADRRARPADRRRCSTSAPSSPARSGGRRPPPGDGRSATPSGSARSCCGSRWRTTGPLPQADLLVIYRRLIDARRALEAGDTAGRAAPTTA